MISIEYLVYILGRRRNNIQVRSRSLERVSTSDQTLQVDFATAKELTNSDLMEYDHFCNPRSYNPNLISIQECYKTVEMDLGDFTYNVPRKKIPFTANLRLIGI